MKTKMIFDQTDERSIVSWNAMIAVYVQQGYVADALNIYNLMKFYGVMPDKVTFISLLDMCKSSTALSQAKLIHMTILHSKISTDIVLVTSLLNAYGKCGAVHTARV